MRFPLLAALLSSGLCLAAGPRTSGTYLPAVAAAHVEQDDFQPIDLATAAAFTRDSVKIDWPSETKVCKWKAAKQGIEVKPDDAFVPISWVPQADGAVLTHVLYAGKSELEDTLMKWVPQSLEALWARFQKRVNAREFKRLQGTWKGAEHTLELSPEKVTWDGRPLALWAGECRQKCAKYGTICLTPPADKVDRIPRLEYLSGTLVEVTYESTCGAIPGEAWGFGPVSGAMVLQRD